MPEHITVYNLSDIRTKAGLVLSTILVVVTAWFGVRFQIGDLLSEITPTGDPEAGEWAETAVSLSPMNPDAYWLKGAISRRSFGQQNVENTAVSFAQAARRGPYHYRWWTELGRAHEQNGDAIAAEGAYARAVELAPLYTAPRWQLGNFYLRQGRNQEAVANLAVAAEHSALYRGQVYAVAWNLFGSDVKSVEQFANERPESRVGLALFFASQNRPDDALRNWNMLDEKQKSNFRRDAETATKSLLNLHSYAGALEFSRQAGMDPSARFETVTNGDFESPMKDRDQPMFDWWSTKRDGKLEIALDGRVKRSGSRSLRLTFRGYVAPWLESVSQTAAIVPGSTYRINFAYRTEELRGGSLPRIEVLSAQSSSLVSSSPPMSSGTNDWQQSSFDFQSPDTPDGVIIKIGREPCQGECPLVGILWIDDIVLARK